MQYISADEFFKQPEKVQKVFLDWWQPEFGDLFLEDYWDEYSDINVVGCVPISKEHFEDYKGKIHYKTDLIIPLFTEGQLREFIEDKTKTVIKLLQWRIEDISESNRGYSIDIDLLERNKYQVTHHYKNLGEDLLQAYWKVTCEIAKENK